MAGARLGGAELFFERLCVALHEAGDEILPVIRRDPARAAALRAAGLPVVELAFGGTWLDWRTTPALRRALGVFAPDVAVSWMSRASDHMPRGKWVTVGRLGGYYDLRHYRACDHLVGNTRGIVAWLRGRGWPASRTHYLPNFSRDFGALAAAPDLADLPRPLLLGLGRLHADKGFDTLIDALAMVPAATLAIAGAGPEDAVLRRRAHRRGVASRVRFLGWREDVGGLLAACDIFVCSSRVEPLGNMVLEAWSARRPVIAAAAAGPGELIRAGVDGILVPLEHPRALAEAIQRLVAQPEQAACLAHAGRARFESEFARGPALRRWREFLQAVAVDQR
jgi:glycosyltransferase involved in cell wall biosynthesis